MKNTFFIFLMVVSGISIGYSQGDEPKKPIEISLQELIQNSKKYNRKYVSVYGYIKFAKAGYSISISKEDFENNNSKKIVSFIFNIESRTYPTVQQYDGKYAVITGFYNSGEAFSEESSIMKNGAISDVRIKFR